MATFEHRIRYIVHQGKSVLLADMSYCPPREVGNIAALLPEYVTEKAEAAVLLLADFTGATFDRNCVERIKVAMVLDRPHLKRAAWVGTRTLPKVYFENMQTFSQRELSTFETRDEALDWLVQPDQPAESEPSAG
jgi:hypothetical protein